LYPTGTTLDVLEDVLTGDELWLLEYGLAE
jgi:hypothetical protein